MTYANGREEFGTWKNGKYSFNESPNSFTLEEIKVKKPKKQKN